MPFIAATDYKRKIKDEHLDMLIDEEPEAQTDAEASAIATVEGYLYERYDTDTIFEMENENRPKLIVIWVTNIVIYFLYERIDDNLIPEQVVKNYDETMKTLREIKAGDTGFNFPLRLADLDGDGEIDEPITTRRIGSSELRDFDIY